MKNEHTANDFLASRAAALAAEKARWAAVLAPAPKKTAH